MPITGGNAKNVKVVVDWLIIHKDLAFHKLLAQPSENDVRVCVFMRNVGVNNFRNLRGVPNVSRVSGYI